MSATVYYVVIGFVVCIFIAPVIGWRSGKGVFGIIIDQRGKYSLSRLQFLLWTSVIAGGYLGIAMAKVISNAERPFIDIPGNVLALLGFSVAGAVGSEAIKSMKIQRARVSSAGEERREGKLLARFVERVINRFETGGLVEVGKYVREEFSKFEEAIRNEAVERDDEAVEEFLDSITALSEMSESEMNKNTEGAREIVKYLREISISEEKAKRIQGIPMPSFLDLFLQEEKEFEGVLDIGKFQMFCWTLVALLIYGAVLLGLASSGPESIDSLPDISTGMLGLMGISQGTYLAMKLPEHRLPR